MISTLIIDDEHLQLERPDGSAPPVYTIPEGGRLTLDASGYKFKTEPANKTPDSVHITIRKRQYYCRWKPSEGRLLIDASVLRPVGSAPPFDGFRAGDTVVIAIGDVLLVGDKMEFDVIWVAMAQVR